MENLFTKELEDTPPLSFTANGEPLIDWSMNGASGGVGDKTENLFYSDRTSTSGNPVKTTQTANSSELVLTKAATENDASNTISVDLPLDAGTYTVSVVGLINTGARNLDRIFLKADSTIVANNIKSGVPVTFTLDEDTTIDHIGIVCAAASTYDNDSIQIMLVSGSAAPASYTPYGYKIPVTCGGETKTIYLVEPLGVSDSINMTDTGVSIPTAEGSNTLSVGTTIQPSSVYIKYKGGDEMVTLTKIGGRYNTALLEIRGLSTDTKPTTEIEGMVVTNGSTYIEIDTGDTYMFDAENGVWHNITG